MYPKLWLPFLNSAQLSNLPGHCAEYMRYVQKSSRRLARSIFHQMIRYQKKLEAKQSILNRIVDIGTDLFAISAVCSYADHLFKKEPGKTNALLLADLFCRETQNRIKLLFQKEKSNTDKENIAVARKLMAKEFEWMENEIIK